MERNEQFNEVVRQLKEHYKEWQDGINDNKKAAVPESLLSDEADRDRLWQCIAEEMEKLTGESRLVGKYATDLAKRMFNTLPKDRLQTIIGDAIKRLENQQNAGNQTCI